MARPLDRAMRALIRFCCLAALLLLAACAGQETTRTGFLSSYDSLQATREHPADLIYRNGAYAATRYSKVMIDPIAWRPADGAPKRDTTTVAELQADFHRSLSQALAKRFTVIAADGADVAAEPGVLRVRGAITGTRRANWFVNLPAMVVGLPPLNPGGASVEIEVLDAGSSQVQLAIVTYSNGMPWNLVGHFQQFGHARRAFDAASELLLEQLTLERGGGRSVR